MQTTTTDDDAPAPMADEAVSTEYAPEPEPEPEAVPEPAPEPFLLPPPGPAGGSGRGRAVRRRFRLLASFAALVALVALVFGVLLVREVGGNAGATSDLEVQVASDARVVELQRRLDELQAQVTTQGEQLTEAQGAAATAQAELDALRPPPGPTAPSSDRPLQPGPMQVALTFDDGPDPRTTPLMLDTLDSLGVKATFFLLGQQAEKYPDLVAEIVRRGHGFGNHSWNHPDLTKLPGEQMQVDQLQRTSDVVAAATGGVRPRCMRPPMGRTNDAVVAAASALGMSQTLWNVDPSDYLQQPPPELAARVANDVKALGPDKGAVVVMHDVGPQAPNTIASITEAVTQLKAAGYTFVALC